MRQRNLVRLVVIIVLALISAYIIAPVSKPQAVTNIAFWQSARGRDLALKQGLDLKGGLQVLLGTRLPPGQFATAEQMDIVRRVVEQRVNGLGVAEPLVQIQNTDKILVELPGVTDRATAIDLIQQTGQLEFVDAGVNAPPEGSVISTTFAITRQLEYPSSTPGGQPISGAPQPGLFRTAFTGEIIQNASPGIQNVQNVVQFVIKPAFISDFTTFTGSRIGQPMCIVLDKTVLSCPVIQSQLNGEGIITGQFTPEGANQLALTLNYGSLPVPLQLETTRDVGATLGAESVRRSIVAFAIALVALAIFMVAYYRLPGILSVLALTFFTVTSLAVFALIPVVLTLPGIAGLCCRWRLRSTPTC
jgi:preprotein translocase subunit SecD